MRKQGKPGNEKQAIAAEKNAAEKVDLARNLLWLRAELKRAVAQRVASAAPSTATEGRVRSLLKRIEKTKARLTRLGVSDELLRSSTAIEVALDASRKRPALSAPRPGGVGIYGLGQGRKVWR